MLLQINLAADVSCQSNYGILTDHLPMVVVSKFIMDSQLK